MYGIEIENTQYNQSHAVRGSFETPFSIRDAKYNFIFFHVLCHWFFCYVSWDFRPSLLLITCFLTLFILIPKIFHHVRFCTYVYNKHFDLIWCLTGFIFHYSEGWVQILNDIKILFHPGTLECPILILTVLFIQ